MIKIYHNNKCSKSRCALDLLNQKKISFDIVEYIKHPLQKKELEELVALLNMKPLDLIRQKEVIFIENYKGKTLPDEQWIEVLLQHPQLMERPIISDGKKAIIARPPEKINDFL